MFPPSILLVIFEVLSAVRDEILPLSPKTISQAVTASSDEFNGIACSD